MLDEKDYVDRLEKIIDKQDSLLIQLDAKFKQQDSLNKSLSNQNQILREDIKKHKDLLRDMNKTVTQHKKVVAKLKKELEEQLKIQQDLHKDYGEVIKELTDELEEEKSKNNTNVSIPSTNNSQTKQKKVELPPKEHETDYMASATNMFNDIKEKTSPTVNNESSSPQNANAPAAPNANMKKYCNNCGSEIQDGYLFCDSCGTKVE